MQTSTAAPRRLLVLGGIFALVATVAGSGVALATPSGPAGGLTATQLADGTTKNAVNFNTDPIKLRTKDQMEVFQVSQAAISGWTSGWHEHTGAVFVNVTAGALTFYASDCTKTVVTAGHAYIESPYDPILVRNEGEVQAAWITTQVIPVNASRRIDVPTARCGVQ
jgi:quercetin dioxygenase-like cupin family protein